MPGYDVEHEVKLVQYHIARLGKRQADGTYTITFGELFNDPKVEQIFESLVSRAFSLFHETPCKAFPSRLCFAERAGRFAESSAYQGRDQVPRPVAADARA
jgi:hypothetical protein